MLDLVKNYPSSLIDFLPELPTKDKDFKRQIIIKIALDNLKELVVISIMTGASCRFVATAAIPTLILSTVAIVAINTCIRYLTTYYSCELHELQNQLIISDIDQKSIEKVQICLKLMNFLCGLSFSILDITTKNILVHEAGHVLACQLVYEKPKPTIEIFPFRGGVTRYFPILPKAGGLLNAQSSELLISAAGTVANIAWATNELAFSHYFRNKQPKLSLHLFCTSSLTILNSVVYALSALWENPSNKGHDFIKLWKVGSIHPLVSVIGIIALPLLLQISLVLFSYKKAQEKTVL